MFNSFKLNNDEIKKWSNNITSNGNGICSDLWNIDKAFQNAANAINGLSEMSHFNYTTIGKSIYEIADVNNKVARFANLPEQYDYNVDSSYHSAQEKQTNNLSNIVLNNITIEDTFDLKPEVTEYDDCGMEIQVKQPISIEDILKEESVDNALKDAYNKKTEQLKQLKEFMEFDVDSLGDEYSEEDKQKMRDAQAQIKAQFGNTNINDLINTTYEKDLETFLKSDDMNYVTRGEKALSVILDLVPVVGTVKGLTEAAIGKDIITGEKLEPWERGMCAVFSLLNLKAEGALIKGVGKEAMKMGTKDAVKFVGKEFSKETTRNAAFYGGSVALDKVGVNQKWQLGLMAAVTVVGHGKRIKGTYDTAAARVKGVSKGSYLDNLKFKDKVTYKKVMSNIGELSRDKSVVLSSNMAGEADKLYNKVKAERSLAKKINSLDIGKSRRETIIDIFAGNDFEKQKELKKVIENGSKEDIIKSVKNYENSFEHSKFGDMSPEDAAKYKEFLEHGNYTRSEKQKIRDRVISNIEKSKHAREVSNYKEFVIKCEENDYIKTLQDGVLEDTAWSKLDKYAEKNDININNMSWDEKQRIIEDIKKDLLSDAESMEFIKEGTKQLYESSSIRLKDCINNGYNARDYYKILNTPKYKRSAKKYLDTLKNTKLQENWHNAFYGNNSSVVISYMPKSAFDNFVVKKGTIGREGIKGGQFVLPEGFGKSIEKKLQKYGSLSKQSEEFKVKLAQELGLSDGTFNSGIVRVEIPLRDEINLHMVSGIEDGCNYQWIPGGKTLGGTIEGIVNQITKENNPELYQEILNNVKGLN